MRRYRCTHPPARIPGVGLLLILLCTSCGRGTGDPGTVLPPSEPVLRVALDTDPAGLDPGRYNDQTSWRVARMLFEGLASFTPKAGVRPGAAIRWEADSRALRYTFWLRPGLVWSDGEPLRASDFVYAWRRVLEPATASLSAGHLYMIQGARAINEGRLPSSSLGARALSDSVLVVDLTLPDPSFPMRTALPPFFPVPEHQVARVGPKWPSGVTPVGNGPFVLDSWRPDDRLVAARNDRYWNASAVTLRQVTLFPVEDDATVWTLYRTGDIDWATTNTIGEDRARMLMESGSDQLHTTPVLQVYYLELNTARPPLDDLRVRLALSLVVPRETIATRLFGAGAVATERFVSTALPDWDPPAIPSGGAEEARHLLAESGHPGGAGIGVLRYLYSSRLVHASLAEYLQGVWRRELGIRVELVPMEFAALLDRADSGDFEILRSGWLADLPDPMAYLKVFRTGDANNATGWTTPGYDTLIDEAAAQTDRATRLALLEQAEEILLAAAPIIPIVEGVSVQLFRPYVSGIVPNVLDVVDWAAIRVDTAWRPR